MDVFSTAFLPNTVYLRSLINSTDPIIDLGEHFIKQTHRNRSYILSANGAVPLIIPLRKTDSRIVKEMEISYAEEWQTKSLRAIRSSYKNSPYYEHYQSEFEEIFMQKESGLYVYNDLLLNWVLKQLEVEISVQYANSYIEMGGANDNRNVEFYRSDIGSLKSYKQVFSYKMEFVPRMSVIDLLFNKGPEALIYLK